MDRRFQIGSSLILPTLRLLARLITTTNAKNTWTMNKLTLLSIASAFALNAQAQYYALLTAPELPMPQVKKIALLDIQGTDGREVTDMLTTQLLAKKRGSLFSKWTLLGTETYTGPIMQPNGSSSIFELAERGQLERVLAEQRLSNSGVVDEAQAAKLGQVLGIDAMLMGSCTYSTGIVTEGDTRKRWVSAKVTMKVVEVNTGKVLGIKTVEKSRESSGKIGEALVGEHDLAISAYDEATVALANYINPYYQVINLVVEKIKVKGFADKAKKAKELFDVEQHDLVGAYTIYKSIADEDAYCAEAWYNMAQVCVAAGDFPRALENYKHAAEIDAEKYKTNVGFAEQRLEGQAILASLGVDPGMVALDAADGRALANMVQTRGSKSDRYNVYPDPKTSPTVVAKVPGDTKFEIVNTSGDWVLIKVLGGKQGYISKEDVKL